MICNYLMYSATAIYLAVYIPTFYAEFKNRNANIYNLPERIFSIIACLFGLSYSIVNHNTELIVNYTPHLILELIILCVKIRFAHKNGWIYKMKFDKEMNTDDIEMGTTKNNIYCDKYK